MNQVVGFAVEIGGMALYRAAKLYPDHIYAMLSTSLPSWLCRCGQQEVAYEKLPTTADDSI